MTDRDKYPHRGSDDRFWITLETVRPITVQSGSLNDIFEAACEVKNLEAMLAKVNSVHHTPQAIEDAEKGNNSSQLADTVTKTNNGYLEMTLHQLKDALRSSNKANYSAGSLTFVFDKYETKTGTKIGKRRTEAHGRPFLLQITPQLADFLGIEYKIPDNTVDTSVKKSIPKESQRQDLSRPARMSSTLDLETYRIVVHGKIITLSIRSTYTGPQVADYLKGLPNTEYFEDNRTAGQILTAKNFAGQSNISGGEVVAFFAQASQMLNPGSASTREELSNMLGGATISSAAQFFKPDKPAYRFLRNTPGVDKPYILRGDLPQIVEAIREEFKARAAK